MKRWLWLAVIPVLVTGLYVRARSAAGDKVGEVQELAPGVFFHQGDIDKGHCNQGWVIFQNFVLVIDGNFPSGAQVVIDKIRQQTDKPIRFAFDTHHHGDHMYGNQVWADVGAVPIAHENVIKEARKYETGYFGGKPGRWEEAAKEREDVANSKLKLPTILFPDKLVFDDGTQRVELRYFGVSHTHGDGWAWLPKQKILFSGDACVNGPYNYVGDGNTQGWPATLAKAQKLGPKIMCPGHGPIADGSLLAAQKAYFQTLHRLVRRLAQRYKTPAEVEAHVDDIRKQIVAKEQIARYVGKFFPAQVEKVYVEQGGKPFPNSMLAAHRRQHDLHHLDLPTKPDHSLLARRPR